MRLGEIRGWSRPERASEREKSYYASDRWCRAACAGRAALAVPAAATDESVGDRARERALCTREMRWRAGTNVQLSITSERLVCSALNNAATPLSVALHHRLNCAECVFDENARLPYCISFYCGLSEIRSIIHLHHLMPGEKCKGTRRLVRPNTLHRAIMPQVETDRFGRTDTRVVFPTTPANRSSLPNHVLSSPN